MSYLQGKPRFSIVLLSWYILVYFSIFLTSKVVRKVVKKVVKRLNHYEFTTFLNSVILDLQVLFTSSCMSSNLVYAYVLKVTPISLCPIKSCSILGFTIAIAIFEQ